MSFFARQEARLATHLECRRSVVTSSHHFLRALLSFLRPDVVMYTTNYAVRTTLASVVCGRHGLRRVAQRLARDFCVQYRCLFSSLISQRPFECHSHVIIDISAWIIATRCSIPGSSRKSVGVLACLGKTAAMQFMIRFLPHYAHDAAHFTSR